jgi:hypothetical protein
MVRARDGARERRRNSWYWVMALGFAALVVTCGVSLIEPEPEGLIKIVVLQLIHCCI